MFCTKHETPLDHHNVLRDPRTIMRKAGLNDKEWTARELCHTFVSLLSDHGVNIEEVSLLMGPQRHRHNRARLPPPVAAGTSVRNTG